MNSLKLNIWSDRTAIGLPHHSQQINRANPQLSYQGNSPRKHWAESGNWEIPKVTIGIFPNQHLVQSFSVK